MTMDSMPSRQVLTINSGSSSIKFALYEMGRAERLDLRGSMERIGLTAGRFHARSAGNTVLADEEIGLADHNAALQKLFEWLKGNGADRSLAAVGHRVVHGGSEYTEPQLITPELMEHVRKLIPFAPEHLPHQVAAIEAVSRIHPDLPQVACFDTAFHHGMPPVAKHYPLPRFLWDQGVIRYGFHGLSYSYIVDALAREAHAPAPPGRIVIAHLGNGCSIAAVRDGRPMDTTMGFTPTGGLMMSTRAGDLDPGVVLYLLQERGASPATVNHFLNRQSGLLGVSGVSSDMQDLLRKEDADPQVAEAIELFCYQARKFLAALAAALGGIDTLVFTAGIGENAPSIRWRICEGLDFMGIALDRERNRGGEAVISALKSRVSVRVMKTDEEIMLARFTSAVVERSPQYQEESSA